MLSIPPALFIGCLLLGPVRYSCTCMSCIFHMRAQGSGFAMSHHTPGTSHKTSLLACFSPTPSSRSSVLDCVAPRFRKGINRTCESPSFTESLLRPGNISKYFPFTVLLLSTRQGVNRQWGEKELTHLSKAGKCYVQSSGRRAEEKSPLLQYGI